jgi:5-methylcytosine-specific restriction protein A
MADRSQEASQYRRLYKTARWERRRKIQLQLEPWCATCATAGRKTPATVADHIVPHRGDERLFFEGKLQSLCDAFPWRCHSKVKQSEERLGFCVRVGPDGFPIDPRHPSVKG